MQAIMIDMNHFDWLGILIRIEAVRGARQRVGAIAEFEDERVVG